MAQTALQRRLPTRLQAVLTRKAHRTPSFGGTGQKRHVSPHTGVSGINRKRCQPSTGTPTSINRNLDVNYQAEQYACSTSVDP
jgi:hypothetical protein